MSVISSNNTDTAAAEQLFQGVIGQEYTLLKVICPEAAEMSQKVAVAVEHYRQQSELESLHILELGCGTGITSLALLNGHPRNQVAGLDNASTMLNQARTNLAQWVHEGRLSFHENDALTYLRSCADHSLDVMASAYTLHNFLDAYRTQVITEIYRVLKPGGLFVNGDRYALDDISEHTQMTQTEVQHYFQRIHASQRYDILEKWLVHLFSDESENHIMRTGKALILMEQVGFEQIELHERQAVNALVIAKKAK